MCVLSGSVYIDSRNFFLHPLRVIEHEMSHDEVVFDDCSVVVVAGSCVWLAKWLNAGVMRIFVAIVVVLQLELLVEEPQQQRHLADDDALADDDEGRPHGPEQGKHVVGKCPELQHLRNRLHLHLRRHRHHPHRLPRRRHRPHHHLRPHYHPHRRPHRRRRPLLPPCCS